MTVQHQHDAVAAPAACQDMSASSVTVRRSAPAGGTTRRGRTAAAAAFSLPCSGHRSVGVPGPPASSPVGRRHDQPSTVAAAAASPRREPAPTVPQRVRRVGTAKPWRAGVLTSSPGPPMHQVASGRSSAAAPPDRRRFNRRQVDHADRTACSTASSTPPAAASAWPPSSASSARVHRPSVTPPTATPPATSWRAAGSLAALHTARTARRRWRGGPAPRAAPAVGASDRGSASGSTTTSQAGVRRSSWPGSPRCPFTISGSTT